MHIAVGTRLGPYEIVSPLGAGGMGEVYRARDTRLNRDVAIKVLPAAFTEDRERLSRFEREAQLLAQLHHPNIASVFGLEESTGVRALVMELVDGEDLSARIARGPVPLDEALPIAKQIADALEAAHEHGIIHRDLKPANVKVRADGAVKVLDFGLAKALDPVEAGSSRPVDQSPTLTARETQMGTILGTAAYMAPEQARGMTVDRRADIWAFGAVFFEMLTGRRPFDGQTVSDVIASVIKERVPLEHLPANVPPPVRTLIARCLEKDPKLRLRDIGEARILLSAPESSAASAAILAPPTTMSRLPNRLLMATAAVLAVLLIVTLLDLRRRSQATANEVVRFDFLPPDTGEVNLTVHPSVSISPDGSTVAYAASSNGVSRLYVRRRDAIDSRQLTGTEEASNPLFSPDGRSVALIAGKKLLRASLDGQATPVATVNDSRGLTWIDPTSIVYAPEAAAGLMRVSVNGGEPKAVTTPDTQKGERSHRWPNALPGGRAVLFTVGSVKSPDDYDASDIEAVTLATGERRVVLRGASIASYAATGHLLFARGGTLFAAPFDLNSLRVTGSGVPIVQGVMGDRTTGAVHFSVASNGTLAYVPGASIGDQHMMAWVDWGAEPSNDLRKTTMTRSLDLPKGAYNDPAISPDGSRVAFIRGTSGLDADVWVYDVQRKSVTRLTFDTRSAAPSWSADGRTIYYSSIESSGSKTTFLKKPADGSREPEPVGSVNWRAYLRQPLPGGTAGIVESAPGGSERNIHRVQFTAGKADTVALEPIVATRADEYGSDVSSDGRWLAYGSDESGRMEVYVRDLSGGGRWQISTGGGEEPHWSADSRRLYYRFGEGLYAVAIDTRNGFSAAMPQLMFGGAYNVRSDTGLTYDVNPRTGGVLMIRPVIDQKTRANIRVVLNWFEELKAKFSR